MNVLKGLADMGVKRKMERAMGIEPTCEAWKASVLPLNYTRNRATAYQPGLRCQSVFPSLCGRE